MFNPLSLLTGGGVSKYIMMGMAAIILIGGGLSYWYYKDSQATIQQLNQDVATYQANEIVLEGAIDEQNETILMMDNQRKIDQVKLNQLSADYGKSRDKVNNLRRLLSKHDIGYLAQEKPGLIQNIVNKGMKKLGADIERLSQPEEVPNE
jgi:hypothetical protein